MSSLSRKQIILFVLAITAFGFFLRAYHFGDWLHFELDQARDARVIDRAVNGDPLDLPLQGPKAGGTSLRLGPMFYYFEYISALFFGATPSGIAVIVMLFSVASIPLFFWFVRRLFSGKLSLLLTLLFASSTFLVFYGRFAWNPNPLPFFLLFGAYALLRAVDHEEEKKGWWLALSAFGFTIATQLHFLAFVALPVIVGTFLLFRWPRISWKGWAAAIGVVIFLYVPVILNDIATGGRNAEEFVKAVTEKNEKGGHSILYKGYKNVSESALGYLVVLSGYEGGALPEWQRVIGDERDFVCDSGCKRGSIPAYAMIFVILSGLVFGIWKYRRGTESRKQSDALLLCGLWFSVSFLLFLPLATSIAPRFFLLVAPLPFVFLGLFVEALRHILKRGHVGYRLGISIVIGLTLGNLFFLSSRFDELSRAGTEPVRSAPDRILKERIRVTLEQQDRIVDLLESESKRTGYPVYMFSEPQHRRALKYLLERRGVENDVLGFSGVYREGLYYLILRTHSDREDAVKKYLTTYDIVREIPFGTLVVIEFSPKKELDLPERQMFELLVPGTDSSDKNPRYTWRELFLRQNAQQEEEE